MHVISAYIVVLLVDRIALRAMVHVSVGFADDANVERSTDTVFLILPLAMIDVLRDTSRFWNVHNSVLGYCVYASVTSHFAL